jgi:uncharacterized membrane protein (DUF4010 family)
LQALELVLVLFLSLLVGLEREEHKLRVAHYAFGGARTFPLIGLFGYGVSGISGGNALALAVGLAAVGALMVVSYSHKLRQDPDAGATSELSGLVTYVIGALVHARAYWLAVALGVVAVLLLELHERFEQLTTRIAPEELVALAKFLLLTTVILPLLPDRSFTRFSINPFRTWLVVVAVSALSYVSYALQRWASARGGAFAAALLGGAYSSTATTVVLARESKKGGPPLLYAGSILAACGMMYLRLGVLIAFFNPPLARHLAWSFGLLAFIGVGVGLWMTLSARSADRGDLGSARRVRNPLELRPAFAFGALFLAMLVATRWAVEWAGHRGLYVLAVLSGLGDVDPLALSVAQLGSAFAREHLAAVSIVLAASANSLAKGGYALLFGASPTGRLAMAALGAFAALGLLPAIWL